MKELFIELRVQEIPSDTLNIMEQTFCEGVTTALKNANLAFGKVTQGSTPRRLWVSVANVASEQADAVETVMGPPTSIAYNDDGTLSVAGQKFLQKNSVDETDLIKTTARGREVVSCKKNIVGLKTVDILPEIFRNAMGSIKSKRSMRWGRHATEFIRPLEGVVCVFGGEPVPNIHLEQDDIPVGNTTLGHRFTSHNQITVGGMDDYLQKMAEGGVVPNYDQRRTMIAQSLETLNIENAPKSFLPSTHKVEVDDDLLHETTNLVEYPYPVVGMFHEKFLQLPKGVLTTTMKVHQRFFNTVTTADNAISNYFVGISNNPFHPNIQEGYERVINARLHDALFFYEADMQTTMDEMTEKLNGIVFMHGLGSVAQKVERIIALSSLLPPTLGVDVDTHRAAQLCKSDLTSSMVYEFPELQGYMGEHYASKGGESPNTALAIREHYLPRFGDDLLPTSHEGAMVAIADKIDSICGAFIAGTPPTGNADPLGIRRHSVGVLRILQSMNYTVSLHRLITESIATYRTVSNVEPLPETHKKYMGTDEHIADAVLKFFETRLQAMNADTVPPNFIQATFQLNRNIGDDVNLALALYRMFQEQGDDQQIFTTIADTFKRINNILKKSGHTVPRHTVPRHTVPRHTVPRHTVPNHYDAKLFTQEEEVHLATALERLMPLAQESIRTGNHAEGVAAVLSIAPVVEAFFDKVMVNHDDATVRENRVALLQQLRKLFTTGGNWEVL